MPTVIEHQGRAIDGSVAIDNGADDGDSINEKALMIETMELIEPRKTIQVPNHILETKTYAKVGQNAIIHAKPAVVHFEGFEVGEKQTKRLVLLNASSDVLRMHIIPPQTRHFNVKYTKPARMVAGMTIECTVEFTPDEWRYYYDCIRIHCPNEENLVVPIHGYPIMSTKEIPRNFTFQAIPVGHRCSKTFPLRCMAPIDFEFNIKYIQPHPAFLVEPLSGIVPANSEAEVTVTFAPFEFQTATMKIELGISQFNSRGIICTFTGNSLPGLLKANTLTSIQSEVLDPRSVSPLDRIRIKKKDKKSDKNKPIPIKAAEKDGIRFPANINCPSAVGKVLMQEPGKLKVTEMRENMISKKASSESSRQMKEAVFDHLVRQNVYEERQNQLRWQVKVGEDPISSQMRFNILEERNKAQNHYMFKVRGDPIMDNEYRRPKSCLTYKRTMRNIDYEGPCDATFDTYSNNMWAVRHAALNKFIQAARKIIIRNRALKKLKSLRTHMVEWRKAINANIGSEITERLGETETGALQDDIHKFVAQKVRPIKFPTYVPPNVKDDMAPDALGNVPHLPTDVIVKRATPYFNLKVPHFYKLQGYQHHSSQTAASGYVPTKRIRTLRSGAEDEVIHLPSDGATTAAGPDQVSRYTDNQEVPTTATPITKAALQSQSLPAVDMLPRSTPVTLTPPEALFKAPNYPSLQIMNPAPGLQVFQAPMPYAEVDYDYHLCPLPRFQRSDYATNKHSATQRKFLDREDTIRGIMTWKKFPSQGLTSLSNHPTLTSVWVPRWDDSFSKEVLPLDVPLLFDQLAPDDAENVMEDDSEGEDAGNISLRPEMVSAQFDLIDPTSPNEETKSSTNLDETQRMSVPEESEYCDNDMFPYGNRMPSTNIPVGSHGPVAREKREEELEYFITKKYNRLGSKVKSKVKSLNHNLTDQEMVLK